MAWSTIHPPIHHRETLNQGLGVEIVSKSILVGQFRPEGTIAVPIRTAEHQGRKEFLADTLVGNSELIWGRTRNILAIPCRVHFLGFLSNESGRDPDGTSATVSFHGLNVGNELPVICAVVHSIALEKVNNFFWDATVAMTF